MKKKEEGDFSPEENKKIILHCIFLLFSSLYERRKKRERYISCSEKKKHLKLLGHLPVSNVCN